MAWQCTHLDNTFGSQHCGCFGTPSKQYPHFNTLHQNNISLNRMYTRYMCNELGVCEGLGANITQWRTKHNPWRYNCLINFRWLDINDYIRPATTGDFIHILHSITLSCNTRRAHGRPLLQILLTTDGLISTTGHSRRRYIQLHNMY